MPLPEVLKDRPELMVGLQIYWDAFWQLSTCRAIGMAEGPVPWLAMKVYADELGMEGLDRTRFYIIMNKMDETYLSLRSEEIKKGREKVKK